MTPLFRWCHTLFVVVLIPFIGLVSCGMPGTIQGGLKDSIAPVLVHANIRHKQVRVSQDIKHIDFYFNEYINIAEPQKIIINPSFKSPNNIFFNKKNMSIRLDSAKKNNTYHIQFFNHVADLNENNKMKNWEWVFSTGNKIDSLEIRGVVLNAETNEPDSLTPVVLYTHLQDSTIFKEKPDYVIMPHNTKGEFRFQYLKNQPYYLFAMESGFKSGKYMSKQEKFGFWGDSIFPTKPQSKNDTSYIIRISKEIKTEVKNNEKTKFRGKKKIVKLTSNLGDKNVLDMAFGLSFNMGYKVKSVNPEMIKICDTGFKSCVRLNDETVSIDTLLYTLNIDYQWSFDTTYKMLIDSLLITDTSYVLAKKDTLNIIVKPMNTYGKFNIKWNDSIIKNPTAIIKNASKKKVLSLDLRVGDNTTNLLSAGTYTIELISDTNHNGVWDIGDYITRFQPEYTYQLEKNTFTLEGDKEEDIVLKITKEKKEKKE